MAQKNRHGLGRGLEALIPDKNTEKNNVPEQEKDNSKDKIYELDINEVEPDRNQPRTNFDEDKLNELADSIKQKGVMIPIYVRKVDDYYQIIAGERRWRASKIAGMTTIPAIINNNLTPQEILELQLIENVQREDINPIDEAMTYKRLIEEFGLTQDKVAERVSKNRTTITNSLRLLKLDERVRDMLIHERIQTGHARALLVIEDGDKQYDLAQRVQDDKLSVREVEKIVRDIKNGTVKKTKEKKDKIDSSLAAVYSDVEENLKQHLGTKVSILPKDNTSGKIEIEYYSNEELDSLIEKLQGIQ